MGDLAIYGAILAFVGAATGVISAKKRKVILSAIGFATAVGGFLLFLGG